MEDAAADATAVPQERFPLGEAPEALRVAARVTGIAIVLSLGVYGGVFAWHTAADFEYFYKAGAWLLAHGGMDRGLDIIDMNGIPEPGVIDLAQDAYLKEPAGGTVRERGMLDWYLPFTHRFMTLFAWMPAPAAGMCWLAMNLATMAAMFRLVGQRLVGLPRRDWYVSQILPFFILAAYWSWEFRLNQINNLTLLMLVGSFVLWREGRPRIAGFWLGLATLIKITPGIVVLWFLLKRQYRVVGAALVTAILAGPVSDVIVLGPTLAAEEYGKWVENAVESGSHRGLIVSQREMDWRNQGLGAVLSRWLHPTDYMTRFDNDPRIKMSYEPRMLNVVELPLERVSLITDVIVVVSLIGLLVLARRPAWALTEWQLRYEWALFVLSMLWFMPVMRIYHMIWAAPAMSLLASGIAHTGRKAWSWLAWAGIGIALAAQIGLVSKWVRATGITQISVLGIAIPMIAMVVRLARNPSAMRADPFERGARQGRPSQAETDATAAKRPAVAAHG